MFPAILSTVSLVWGCDDLNYEGGDAADSGAVDAGSGECLRGWIYPHIEMSASAVRASHGDKVTLDAAVTVNGEPEPGVEVTFRLASKPAGSAASLSPERADTDDAGRVRSVLEVGVTTGTIVVQGLAGDDVAEVAVEVGGGQASGVVAVGETERGVCRSSLEIAVRLTDAFGNPVERAGTEVAFSAAPGEVKLDPATDETDRLGVARTMADTSGLGDGRSATVTARVTGIDDPGAAAAVTLTRVSGAPIAASFVDVPAFRLSVLQIGDVPVRADVTPGCEEDRTCNALAGIAARVANPELEKSVEARTINVILACRGMTADNLAEGTVDCAVLNGICGPDPAAAACRGNETEFQVDPGSYDSVTTELLSTDCGVAVSGARFELFIDALSVPFPTEPPVSMDLCAITASGTVDGGLSAVSDILLTGAVSEQSMSVLVEPLVGMRWEGVKNFIGEPDTFCPTGEPAYSVRFGAAADAVTLVAGER